ncbi:unnamed protein product [Cuscuta europaea]|uniref:Uncharacterized protein n=1 Tax=Cuscuta europaea TaxID=41803 RepID=A0A9P0YRX2_CUSEU|nr:unnamed protein product [Cuscuta europaea]
MMRMEDAKCAVEGIGRGIKLVFVYSDLPRRLNSVYCSAYKNDGGCFSNFISHFTLPNPIAASVPSSSLPTIGWTSAKVVRSASTKHQAAPIAIHRLPKTFCSPKLLFVIGLFEASVVQKQNSTKRFATALCAEDSYLGHFSVQSIGSPEHRVC